MATPTYTPIESQTLSSNATLVNFSSIPSTYTDLVLVINGGQSVATANAYIQFNNDTGSVSSYSYTYVGGNGSSAVSARETNINFMRIDNYGWPSSNNANCIIQIQNYSNTSTYKTVLSRFNTAAYGTQATVGLWRKTEAINAIRVRSEAYQFLAGTTFTLYGIANAAIGAPKATGGIITYDNTYYYHTFGASGTFTPKQSLTADVLIIAGGGGGGGEYTGAGGGGGAGGVVYASSQSLTATGYTVTVGGGGAVALGRSANGGNSSFTGLTTAVGGGGGPDESTSSPRNGSNGGSGSGSSIDSSTGGSPTSGQGYAGGLGKRGPSNNILSGGGGGGAGGAGADAGSS